MNRKLGTRLLRATEYATMHKLPDIKQKCYCDHGSNQLKPLETSGTVEVRGDGVWDKSMQVLTRVAPMSYLMELEWDVICYKHRTSLCQDMTTATIIERQWF